MSNSQETNTAKIMTDVIDGKKMHCIALMNGETLTPWRKTKREVLQDANEINFAGALK